jgi:hypothetical protein
LVNSDSNVPDCDDITLQKRESCEYQSDGPVKPEDIELSEISRRSSCQVESSGRHVEQSNNISQVTKHYINNLQNQLTLKADEAQEYMRNAPTKLQEYTSEAAEKTKQTL